MSTHKRGNSWYIDFRFNHRRYRQKSPENSKAGAQAYESVLRQKLSRGESIEFIETPPTTIPIFADFCEEWMTKYVETNNKWSEIVSKRTILKSNILPFFGRLRLDQITNRHIDEYKTIKMRAGLKNKTINNHLSCLRKCLNTANDWGIIEFVPKIKLLKVPPPQTTFLTQDECSTLLGRVDGNWRDMILFVLLTGLRFGELSALMWTDIDFVQKIITVQRSFSMGKLGSTKGNKIRKIPLAEDLLFMLGSKKRFGKYIFAEEDGEPPSQSTYCKKMLELSKYANSKKVTWHLLRHTFASHLANSHVVIQSIQILLGHSDLKTTMRYAHIAPNTLVEAIDLLPKHSSQGIWTQDGHKEENTPATLMKLTI
jgi:integrase